MWSLKYGCKKRSNLQKKTTVVFFLFPMQVYNTIYKTTTLLDSLHLDLLFGRKAVFSFVVNTLFTL